MFHVFTSDMINGEISKWGLLPPGSTCYILPTSYNLHLGRYLRIYYRLRTYNFSYETGHTFSYILASVKIKWYRTMPPLTYEVFGRMK